MADGLGRIWDRRRSRRGGALPRQPDRPLAGRRACSPGRSSRRIGTKNVFSASTVDQMPKHVQQRLPVRQPRTPSRCPTSTAPTTCSCSAPTRTSRTAACAPHPTSPGRMAAIRERGGRIVTVDPRRTEDRRGLRRAPGHPARHRRPVAGGAGHRDRPRRAGRPGRRGRPRRRARAPPSPRCAPFTADSVAAHTRIDADTTRRIARELAAAPDAPRSTDASAPTPPSSAPSASWLVEVLNIVTGNLDRAGGAMFPASAVERAAPRAAPRGPRLHRRPLAVAGRRPSRGARRDARRGAGRGDRDPGPGQVRALITSGRQPGPLLSEQRPAGRRAGVARVHGVGRHLPERDDPPRRRDPPVARPAGQAPLRLRVLRAVGPQRRQLLAAAARRRRSERARAWTSTRSSPGWR